MINTKLVQSAIIVFSAITLSAFGPSVQAVNLITNGGFEVTTNGANRQVRAGGNLTNGTQLIDWSLPEPNNSYTFVFAEGAADTVGAQGQYGNLKLWGPGTGENNGLPATSPDGGNYIAFDSAFQNPLGATLDQTVNGLNPGKQYKVSFYWAAAQQSGFRGDTTDRWDVTFAGVTQSTATVNLPDKGFTGWFAESFNFTANNTSEVLSFFATGGPEGLPPFALLDGVSVEAVPEPLTILGTIAAVGFGARFKLRSKRA